MIDLDVRLDSSLDEEEYGYLSRLLQKEKKEFTPLNLTNNREDYLKARIEVLDLLQEVEGISFAVNSLIHRLYRQGYDYIELGVTPSLHAKCGLTTDRFLKTVFDAIDEALEQCNEIDVNVIVYLQKEADNALNVEVINSALKFKNRGLVAFGIEGIKGKTYAMLLPLIRRIKKNDFPLVFELDENFNNNNAVLRLMKAGVNRFISPYGIDLTNQLAQDLFANNIYLEYRPTFDLINEYHENIEDLPLLSCYSKGFNAYLSGCSYGICKASLINECCLLQSKGLVNKEMIQQSLSTSIQASFASLYLKGKLVKRMVKDFDFFYSKTIN